MTVVGGLYLLYLTPLYDLTQQVPAAHALLLAHLLLAGCLYTWAIAGPDPAPRRPGMVTRLAVLVSAAGAHAYLAKLLYARAGEPAAHGHHGGTAEAETAAQLMYYGGDVAEILLAVMLFAGWYRRTSAVRSRGHVPTAGPQSDHQAGDHRGQVQPVVGPVEVEEIGVGVVDDEHPVDERRAVAEDE